MNLKIVEENSLEKSKEKDTNIKTKLSFVNKKIKKNI